MKNPLLPFRAVIKGIKKESEGVRTYNLSLKEGEFNALPGQFNMLGYPGVGEAPISLSSIGKNTFEHTIRAVGRVTDFLESLQKGDEVFLRGPYGSAWPIDEAKGKDLILVAGGLGVAPLRPVIQTLLKDRMSFGNITLIFGARNPEGILFMDEIMRWQSQISVILTVDEIGQGKVWRYNTGIVVSFMEGILKQPEKTLSFICGPELMMRFVSRKLLSMGLPASRIYVSVERRMKCGIAQCGHCQMGSKFVCKDGPVFPYKDIVAFPDGLL